MNGEFGSDQASMMRERQRGPGTGRTLVVPLFTVGLVVILAMAAWVRFSGLADRELWFDESCTFYASHHLLDWPTSGPDPRHELAHIPYFFLLHLWTRLAGETAWGLRSFSVVLGCLGVLGIGLTGTRMAGKRVGLIAAALAALHPLHVYYSQEARVYTLWTAEAGLALYLLYTAATTLRARWWVVYAVTTWLTVATHYYTLLWLPASIMAVLVASDRRRFLQQWLCTHVALALALTPMIWWLVVPLSEGGPKPWLREMWQGYPPAWAIPKSLWALLPVGGYPDYLGTLAAASHVVESRLGTTVAHIVLFGPAAFMAVVGFTVLRRTASNTPGQPGLLLFLAGHTIVFLLTAFCYSLIAGPVYIVGRYDLAAWPAVIIGVAALIDADAGRFRWSRRAHLGMCTAMTAALLACSMVTLTGARAVPVNNQMGERAKRIAAAVGPDDLVVSVAMYRWFMTHEWHQLDFHPEVVSFPPIHDRQLCWDNPEAEVADQARLVGDIAEMVGRIVRTLADGRRVWLIAHGEPTGPRWNVDQHFFAALPDAGIEVRPHDEWAGLAELIESSR